MNKVPFGRPQEPRRRDGATYTCTDGTQISCRCEVLETNEEVSSDTNEASTTILLRNGILLRPHILPITIVSGTLMSRDMKKVIRGGFNKTYVFPSTTITVGKYAFSDNKVTSVKFNKGLKTLEKECFESSGIR